MILIAPNKLVKELWELQFKGVETVVQSQPVYYSPDATRVIQAEIERLQTKKTKG